MKNRLNTLMVAMLETAVSRAVQGQIKNQVANISNEDVEKARAAFIEHTNPDTLRGVLVITVNDVTDPIKGRGAACDMIMVGTGEMSEKLAALLQANVAKTLQDSDGEPCPDCGGFHDLVNFGGEPGTGDPIIDAMLRNIGLDPDLRGRPATNGLDDLLLQALLLGPTARRR